MFLLVFILILVVFFCVLPHFSPQITKQICIYLNLYQITDEELNLRSEITDLKSQQDSISMTEEFAKYAKLQRRIDKLLGQVKEHSTFRSKHTAMLTLGVKVGIYIMHGFIMLSLILSYKSEPLLEYPPEVFYPLQKLVAFPTGVSGGLGVTCWILVCSAAVYRIKKLFIK